MRVEGLTLLEILLEKSTWNAVILRLHLVLCSYMYLYTDQGLLKNQTLIQNIKLQTTGIRKGTPGQKSL